VEEASTVAIRSVAISGVRGKKSRLNACRVKRSHVKEKSTVTIGGVAVKGVRGERGRLHVCRAERSHVKEEPPSPSEAPPSEAAEARGAV
jgi:hypothetical protein